MFLVFFLLTSLFLRFISAVKGLGWLGQVKKWPGSRKINASCYGLTHPAMGTYNLSTINEVNKERWTAENLFYVLQILAILIEFLCFILQKNLV